MITEPPKEPHAEIEMDWTSEQAVVDALVDAVDVGDSNKKVKLAQALLDGYAQRDWHRRRIVESGGLLLHSEMNPDSVAIDDLKDLSPASSR